MRKTYYVLLAAFLLGPAGRALARTDYNVNVDEGAACNYDTVPNTLGNINLKGDLLFMGSNPWILHTPNDSRTPLSLFLAPGYLPNWNAQTRFDNNGDVTFSRDIIIKQHLLVGNVTSTGNCPPGISTLTMAVGGRLGARGIFVVAPAECWPDYVFARAYRLPPLREVAQFVAANHHLPEMPSAAAVQAEGLDLGRMDALLLKKVQELTLYLLELKQENEALRARVSKLEH